VAKCVKSSSANQCLPAPYEFFVIFPAVFQHIKTANHQMLHEGMVDISSIAPNYLGKLFA